MPVITLPNDGWVPERHQLPLWRFLEAGGRRALAVWHRRAGKDDVCLRWMAICAMEKVATYWYMLPMQRQARRTIWEAVNPRTGRKRIDEAFPAEIRKRTLEQEMAIELINGSMVHLLGSDNYNSLVGSPPFGVVFSEYALAKPAAWAFIRPILRENGGWALFITTPRGKNHAHDMMLSAQKRMAKAKLLETEPEWYCETLTAMDTDVFTTEQLEEEYSDYVDEFGIEDGKALFEQEYFCSFESAVRGSYWGAEMVKAERDGRIISGLKPLPGYPVHTCWDIGVDNATSIWWFQVTPTEVRWLYYYEQTGMGLSHFADKKAELGRRFGYSYEGSIDYVPHDAKQRSWTSTNKDGTARQRLEDMRALKLNPQLVPNHARADGINAGRRTISRSLFNRENTEEGRECLKNYQRLWDADKKVYAKTPFHNWAVNGADSFRYGSIAWRGVEKPKKTQQRKGLPVMSPSPDATRGAGVVHVDPVGNMRTGLTFAELRDRKLMQKAMQPIGKTTKTFDQLRDAAAKKRRKAAQRG